ncbi:LysE family translocator [Plesiomonas shigelloides]
MLSAYIDMTSLMLFIPTFFFVSFTPGMCMTLAMTLGMSIGVRRTLPMMWGELIGVAVVAVSSVIGVASLMLNYPTLFQLLKYAGGAYLIYLGIRMWLSSGAMQLTQNDEKPMVSARSLAMQGFMTAISNPKGWVFMVSLLPPFVNPAKTLAPQLSVLISIILFTEFACLLAYAGGGQSLRYFLQKSGNVQWLNRIAGSLMIFVGIWLAVD